MVGLAGMALGCRAASTPPLEPLVGPLVLGWRLVLGSEHTWRTVVRRQVGPRVVSRAEAWTYRVRQVDDVGTALLQGRLTGFGAGRVDVDGTLVPADEPALAAEQARLRPVALRLSTYGELEGLTTRHFAEGLVHQLLGLRLPSWAVTTGDEWSAPGLASCFTGLLPSQANARAAAVCRLVAVEPVPVPTVRLQTLGEVRVPEGPRLVFEDTAHFNAERGLLQARQVTARLDQGEHSPGTQAGVLSLSLSRVSP